MLGSYFGACTSKFSSNHPIVEAVASICKALSVLFASCFEFSSLMVLCCAYLAKSSKQAVVEKFQVEAIYLRPSPFEARRILRFVLTKVSLSLAHTAAANIRAT